MTQLPIPVHVGSESPAFWDDVEARQREHGEDAAPWLQEQSRPAIASSTVDWDALGFEPRWVDFYTGDCVTALQPSIFTGRGADEFDRFKQGAESRGETALVISPVGVLQDKTRNVFGPRGDAIYLGHRHNTRISASPLGAGARVRPAARIGDADSQLALRILSCKPAPTWCSLSLNGITLEGPSGTTHHQAQGSLLPIVETELGEPVVAVWVSPDGAERRYIVPTETPWPLLLTWLLTQALPEYVPGAMRRARHLLADDQGLMTRGERDARIALKELEADYLMRRSELERALEDAQALASTVREGLLYGTGKVLEDAVRSVFLAADVTVVDLDDLLGGTKNADLLCTYGTSSRLVEVKSMSGRASENAYQDLLRHLREWPSLPGAVPVNGGALVLNHEHRKVPHERKVRPYNRPEFLAAQTEPIITTLDLFTAWREDDSVGIRNLLFGPLVEPVVKPTGEGMLSVVESGPTQPNAGRRRWFRRR